MITQGRYTDPPRQVIPGEPAKAGKSLERAVRNLVVSGAHRSSPSLSSLSALPASRPGTPGLEMTRATSCPNPYEALAHMQSDNTFLRTLVEQSTREKAIFANTIERLSGENDSLKEDVEVLKTRVQQLHLEAQQAASERNILRSVVNQFQSQQRSTSGPFGVIGSNRLSQQGRPGSRQHEYDFTYGGSTDTSPERENFQS